MSDENADKPWLDYIGEWDGRVDPPHAFMAGRASRDAEVAELREQLAERDAVIEQTMSDLERIERLERQVEVLRKAIGLLVISVPPAIKWMDDSWEKTK